MAGREVQGRYWKHVPYNIANHIVIDIETLGIAKSGTLTSIGAVFMPSDGEIGEFYSDIKLESALQFGTPDASTLKWWFGPNIEEHSRIAMSTGSYDTLTALTKFAEWANQYEVDYYWGNSPDFDMGNIGDKMDQLGIKHPWNFRQLRDMRTIMIPEVIPDFHNWYRDLKKEINHIPHHALSDAILEAFVLKKYIDHLYDGISHKQLNVEEQK